MRALLVTFSALLLAGCVAGRTASNSNTNTSISVPAATGSGTVAVAVHDRRPYAISGLKPEHLAWPRFGSLFDRSSPSGSPLATDLRDILSRSLTSQGYKVTGVTLTTQESADAAQRKLMATGARRSALLTLSEWRTSAYDATLAITDDKGTLLATSAVRGSDNLGYTGSSPDPTITTGFAKKLEVLFNDPQVLAALR